MYTPPENNESEYCPLCGKEGITFLQSHPQIDADYYRCILCGEFGVTELFTRAKLPPDHRVYSVVREHWERHKERMLVSTNNFDELRRLAPDDKDVQAKAQRLLVTLASMTQYPGQSVDCVLETDYPLAYCHDRDDFSYFLDHLKRRRLVEQIALGSSGWTGRITPDGWAAIETYKARNIESDKVFVAMWFEKQMDSAYSDGIRPAIEDDCGFRAIKIDLKEFLGDIVDEIIAEIRESRFVVADFTGQRPGVYYEAGFARGLGLPVVWTCRKDDIKKLHFDTSHQNHIEWETSKELRERLTNRIRAAIGLGPHKKT